MAAFTAKFQLNNISRNLIFIVHFICKYMNIFYNELNWQNFINWIGLDLFNDDTCPTEHISRPTQVGSLTVYNFWQVISDRRIRLLVKIPLCKSRESSQEGLQRVSSVVFIPNFLQSCTFQEHVVNGQRLCTMMASSGRSSAQDMGLLGVGMTNSKPGDDNLLSSG